MLKSFPAEAIHPAFATRPLRSPELSRLFLRQGMLAFVEKWKVSPTQDHRVHQTGFTDTGCR
ncbi:hypothetical protein [Mycoplana dimorpha]|uniref:hypothetical protein n=1 Tax=Mycoplana dimorpha TaxID=28320 RepID=UPI000D3B97AA|nr:hypothetical protein [Mycoplana dimorpha]